MLEAWMIQAMLFSFMAWLMYIYYAILWHKLSSELMLENYLEKCFLNYCFYILILKLVLVLLTCYAGRRWYVHGRDRA